MQVNAPHRALQHLSGMATIFTGLEPRDMDGGECGREKYQRVLAMAKRLPPVPTAVVHPCDAVSLAGAV